MRSTLLAALVVLIPLVAAAQHECGYCHGPHGAAGTSLTNRTDSEVLCLTCHGPAGSSALRAEVHSNSKSGEHAPFRISCVDCHDPHGNRENWLGQHVDETDLVHTGINVRAVGRRVDGTGLARIDATNRGPVDVVFEFRGLGSDDVPTHSFADDDRDRNGVRDGICEVCHSTTRVHRYDGQNLGPHHRGEDCTDCHAHVDGFNPEPER